MMNKNQQPTTIGKSATTNESTPLVIRSTVPPGQPYNSYKRYLRRDFLYSCAYCTIAESEATAIRFTIDHLEPKYERPELTNEYSNLMYCCDTCNLYKGDRIPSDKARADGIRFFRPDVDPRSDHFELKGVRVEGRTQIANFSILAISLNRLALRKLREIRKRLTDCDRRVVEGIMTLRRFQIDQLPPDVKGSAVAAIAKASAFADTLAGDVEGLLRQHARSPLDGDEDEDQTAADALARERLAEMKQFEGLYPGRWRAPRNR